MITLPWDEVVCELSANRELPTETVRVTVLATSTTSAEAAPRLRTVVSDALKSALVADWSFAGIERSEDKSGLERVSISATARVREQETAGLVERLKAASKPGLRLDLGGIEYAPPRAEIASALRELRRQIYRDAQAEADLLNQDLSAAEHWRVGAIRVENRVEAPTKPTRHQADSVAMYSRVRTMEAGEASVDDSVSAVTRLTVTGKVTLKRPSLPAPEGGYFNK